jgi:predicted  nucleic acid-binding Zn ribbon protein
MEEVNSELSCSCGHVFEIVSSSSLERVKKGPYKCPVCGKKWMMDYNIYGFSRTPILE